MLGYRLDKFKLNCLDMAGLTITPTVQMSKAVPEALLALPVPPSVPNPAGHSYSDELLVSSCVNLVCWLAI